MEPVVLYQKKFNEVKKGKYFKEHRWHNLRLQITYEKIGLPGGHVIRLST